MAFKKLKEHTAVFACFIKHQDFCTLFLSSCVCFIYSNLYFRACGKVFHHKKQINLTCYADKSSDWRKKKKIIFYDWKQISMGYICVIWELLDFNCRCASDNTDFLLLWWTAVNFRGFTPTTLASISLILNQLVMYNISGTNVLCKLHVFIKKFEM